MKAETYNAMKRAYGKLYKLVDKLSKLWGNNFSHLITISVLLQNMQFVSTSDTQEYDIQKIKEYIDVIGEFKDYFHSHIEQWIYEEASMIYEGALMSDDLDDEDFAQGA
jgi:hypothetical protein